LATYCVRCGKETKGKALYCQSCEKELKKVEGRKLLQRICLVSLLFLLFLFGMVFLARFPQITRFLRITSFFDQPLAIINGEKIMKRDVNGRLEGLKEIIDAQYGEGFFQSKEGELKRLVLERMIEECLIRQEAKRLGLTISDEEVKREMRNLKALSPTVHADIDRDVLEGEIRNLLLKKVVKESKDSAGVDFVLWLNERKKRSTVKFLEDFPRRGAQCCTTFPETGGCCEGKGKALDRDTVERIKRYALQAYRESGHTTEDVEVVVEDFGCHLQVDLKKKGSIVKSFSYRDGRLFEI